MQTLLMNPTEIKVSAKAARSRVEMGDLQALSDSIKKKRQIVPIIITRDYELIDGGRRLAACIMAGVQVKCVFEDVADAAELKELEIEANCHRKDFTPAEKASAVEEFHKLKQLRHGTAVVGSPNSGWTLNDTASALGMSRANVSKQLEISEMIQAFPELAKAKKSSEVIKAAKSMQKIAAAVVGAKEHEKVLQANKDTFSIHHCNALEHMPTVADKSINLLLTDPIYGIDADKTAINIGGKTGGDLTSAGYKIPDRKPDAFIFYRALARESYRFCADDAHGYIFIGPEHVRPISAMFRNAGWRVHVKPLIWIKREVGQCNVPASWPASCYETLIYIRKDVSVLVKQGMPDWIECPPVPPSQKTHPYEKPVALLTNLISRSAMPGQTLYDPFAGSGATLEAAVRYKLFAIGVDINDAAILTMKSRMATVMAELQGKK